MRRVGGPVAVALLTLVLVFVTVMGLTQAVGRTNEAIGGDQRTIAVAELQGDVVAVIEALMMERGRRAVYEPGSIEVEEAQARVDGAIAELRSAWVSAAPEVRVGSGLADLFVALDQLDTLRASATPGEGYTLTVTTAINAFRDSQLALGDADSIVGSRAMTALVDLAAALAQQRRLVGLALVNGPTESIGTEIEVTRDQATAALSRLNTVRGDDTPAVGLVERQPEVVAVVDAVVSGAPPDVGLDQWWGLATTELEAIFAEITDLNDRLISNGESSLGELESERRLELAAIVATVGAALAVGFGAAATLRAQRRASEEYEALAAGIQAWFHDNTLPDIDGIDAAGIYRPASDHVRAGGDWYDLFVAGGRVVAVVGDVVGHGPQATADMAKLRHLIRGLVTCDGPLLDGEELDRRLGDPAPMATAIVVAIDLATNELRYHRAGHPPALVRRKCGVVETLDDAACPPLGTGFPATRPDATRRFESGDTLLLYTDGLIERPAEIITTSIATLARTVATASPEPATLVEAVAASAPGSDDFAVLAIHAR